MDLFLHHNHNWRRLAALSLMLCVGLGLAVTLLASIPIINARPPASSATSTWTAILTETFEASTDQWLITDTNGMLYGEYYWGTTAVTASQGITSAWATGAGLSGTHLTPLVDSYPANTASYLQSPPLNISGTTGLSLTIAYHLASQPISDTFVIATSIDGITFTTQAILSGTSEGWQTLALPLAVPTATAQLWLSFAFYTDAITHSTGLFLDDITLWGAWPAVPITATTYLPSVHRPEPTPTATPIPPTPTPIPPPDGPEWLDYVNLFREHGNLPYVVENETWSAGGLLHSQYMVKNDYVGHDEDPGNPWYTVAGAEAADHGNVYVTSYVDAPDQRAIDYWMSATFHGISILDPQLITTAMGSYREEDGGWQMAATLDVGRGRDTLPDGVTFPLPFPRDGGTTWITTFFGNEYPDPLSSCPGYTAPTGPALYLQVGDGSQTPTVTAVSLTENGIPVSVCSFNETNYVNEDSYEQSVGRIVLNNRDAVILLPQNPLVVGATYVASVTVDEVTITWEFTAVSPPTTLTAGQGK